MRFTKFTYATNERTKNEKRTSMLSFLLMILFSSTTSVFSREDPIEVFFNDPFAEKRNGFNTCETVEGTTEGSYYQYTV